MVAAREKRKRKSPLPREVGLRLQNQRAGMSTFSSFFSF
jgi:hypothetical protein